MDTEQIVEQAERDCAVMFRALERVAFFNQKKVLEAFREHRIAQRHFASTTGYGYDDIGRDTLAKVYAHVFHAQAAIVSPALTSGTHALSTALFGLLRPGDTMVSITNAPYDTLKSVITGVGNGSLADFGISYAQVDMDGIEPNYDAIRVAVRAPRVKLAFIQRSRGYEWRDALPMETIRKLVETVKSVNPKIIVMVDNCYGEFVDVIEPTDVGADIVVGSCIKNIGGGLAPTGGYIVGTQACVDLIAQRLTAPGIGGEVGSYAYGYQYFYQGLFMAPHTVCQALKGSALVGGVFHALGYETLPAHGALMGDIIRSVKFKTKEELIAFCQAVQFASPIDSFVTPEPWEMPGYEHEVIMAAGTFVGGASIELSCDSPIKEPYIAYMQGGLTYEHVRLAVLECLLYLSKKGLLSIAYQKTE